VGMSEEATTQEAIKSRATALTRMSSQSKNLWRAYLSAFWDNTVIEGKKISEWLRYFSVTPLNANDEPLTEMVPKQINEYSVLLLRRINEAHFYYNKLKSSTQNLEHMVAAKVDAYVKARVDHYREEKTKCPAKETLIRAAKGSLLDEYACLRRGYMEVSFFETILKNLKEIRETLNNVSTANAHEIRMME